MKKKQPCTLLLLLLQCTKARNIYNIKYYSKTIKKSHRTLTYPSYAPFIPQDAIKVEELNATALFSHIFTLRNPVDSVWSAAMSGEQEEAAGKLQLCPGV